ncbi:MAG: DUF929 family protein [Ktedonobacteraceae bacterium]|nr:DUF929 family protein [Ktedonobacteraceae bacterium]
MAKAKQRATKQNKARAQQKQQSQVQQRTQVEVQQKPRVEAQQKSPQLADGTQNIRVRKSLGMPRRGKRRSWIFIGSVITLVVVAVSAFLVVRLQQDSAQRRGEDRALQAVATVDPQLLSTVGPGSVTVASVMHAVKDAPLLKGPHGRPEFFYVGGEYCANCAVQRWAVAIALSRFGKFDHLDRVVSAEGHIVTFTFHKSSYTSQYVDLVALETTDNQQPQPHLLDQMTGVQQQVYDKYGQPPYVDKDQADKKIPFIDIANQQVSVGAYFSSDVLSGHSYQDVIDQLKDTNSDIARDMLGSANYLTAALCVATGNQPANVCGAAPIPTMQKALPKPSSSSTGNAFALSGGPILWTRRA